MDHALKDTTDVTGADQRINNYLLNYWENIAHGKSYPHPDNFDLADIDTIADTCFLVKVSKDGEGFSYVYLGSDLVDAYGGESVAREACQRLAFPSNNSLLEKFRDVVMQKKPMLQEDKFTNSAGLPIRYRCIMLPLGDADHNQVQYIVGGMRWKAYL